MICVAIGCGRGGSAGLAVTPSDAGNPPPTSQAANHFRREKSPAAAPMIAAIARPSPRGVVLLSGGRAPGPSNTVYESPTAYSCARDYYVSPGGNDSNNGTGSGSPWLTLTHAAAQNLTSGSCINVAPGIYQQSASLRIVHGGTQASPAGYVAWRCEAMPFSFFDAGKLLGEGSGCVVRASAVMFALVSITTPYVIFDGFELDGNIFEAQRGFQVTSAHHIWLLNSDVHHSGQNGISLVWTEWLFVIHDVWHDNSACSVNFTAPCTETIGSYGSGLSIWEPNKINGYVLTTADKAFCSTVPVRGCFHIVVAYNVAYHNYNGQTGSANTDGEGIIFDTWDYASYAEGGLIMGNIVYDNGGNGIEVYRSASAGSIVIANNTVYANNWDGHDPYTWRGAIYQDNGYNVTNINNIAYAVIGSGILANNAPFLAEEEGGSSSWSNNLSYPGGRNRFAPGSSYSSRQ